MLFDLSGDMGEVHNIALREPETHQRLFQDMMNYFEKVGARIPKLNPDFDASAYQQDKEYQRRKLWGAFTGSRPLEDSPTRAALMTGSHSTRVGIGGVMFPRNNHGLNPDEITLPELLKDQGYATAIIGKWHLGNQDIFQPLKHGFAYWYGTPASNSQFYYPLLKTYALDCVYREGYTCDGILKRETAACPLIQDNIQRPATARSRTAGTRERTGTSS